jgi:hypothetical protein
MSEKVLCKCGWCLCKNPKGTMITKRTKHYHEQRSNAVELDDNGFPNKKTRVEKRR